ncbi:MAG: DUF6657 family protein [Rectinemataceae bacterium]|jgi:uncharacterized protein (DUF2164 family)
MAMIKSALEIALERSKDIKVDEAALEANALRVDGKKGAGRYLDDPASGSLAEKLGQYPKDKRAAVREGMFDVLVSQIQLPINDTSAAKLDILSAGFSALATSAGTGLLGGVGSAVADKRVQALFQQLAGFFKQYLDDMKNVEQAIRKQWGPKIREKERQMAARMGQDVRIDPMSDPEFAAFYKQNVSAARAQYQAALDKAKEDLAAILGIEKK